MITMSERLVYFATGSQTLSILNLSSYRITNEGARALSKALRSNRSVSYLNLANNWIDDGSLAIIEVLQPFLLKCTEIQATLERRMMHLSKRNNAMLKNVGSLFSAEPNTVPKEKRSRK